MHGFLVVDKPGGVTSRDMVDLVQRRLPRKVKVGHAGTLDPLATGVLVLAVGVATRLIEYVQERGKTYLSTFRFGVSSDTDDSDGRVESVAGAKPIDEEMLRRELENFVGVIEQVPPIYSAVHVDGKRAYDLARKGEEVTLMAKPVHIDAIRLLSYAWPDGIVEIDCGKGTYIRSIARDLGARLGVGGIVQTLHRSRIGDFTLAEAVSAEPTREEIVAKLLPLVRGVDHLPHCPVSETTAADLFQGRQAVAPAGAPDGEVAIFHGERLIGIGEIAEGRLRGSKMLKTE